MDRNVLVVVFAVSVVNWMFSEWLWALFRVRRQDRAPRRLLSATLSSFGSVAFVYTLDAPDVGASRLLIACAIVGFCFVFFAGDVLSKRAESSGFPGLDVDVPGFDPERRPIFSGAVLLAVQIGLLALIAGVVR